MFENIKIIPNYFLVGDYISAINTHSFTVKKLNIKLFEDSIMQI